MPQSEVDEMICHYRSATPNLSSSLATHAHQSRQACLWGPLPTNRQLENMPQC